MITADSGHGIRHFLCFIALRRYAETHLRECLEQCGQMGVPVTDIVPDDIHVQLDVGKRKFPDQMEIGKGDS